MSVCLYVWCASQKIRSSVWAQNTRWFVLIRSAQNGKHPPPKRLLTHDPAGLSTPFKMTFHPLHGTSMCACVCPSVCIHSQMRRVIKLIDLSGGREAWRPWLHGRVWESRSIVCNLEHCEPAGTRVMFRNIGDVWCVLLRFPWIFCTVVLLKKSQIWRTGNLNSGNCLVHGTVLHSFGHWF